MRYGAYLKFLPLLLIAGCASQGRFLENPSQADREPAELYYLEEPSQREARVNEFLALHPSPDEMDKINFLIDSMSRSQKPFIRNGMQHNSFKAAHWLKWKMHHKQFRSRPIETAQDFVTRVASQSVHSGEPYGVIFKPGLTLELGKVLQHELDALEEAILQHRELSPKSKEPDGGPGEGSFKNSASIPQMITRAAAPAS